MIDSNLLRNMHKKKQQSPGRTENHNHQTQGHILTQKSLSLSHSFWFVNSLAVSREHRNEQFLFLP